MNKSFSPEVNVFIQNLPEDRKEAFTKLLAVIQDNLPGGFEQNVEKMINWVVPLERFPKGYHCTPGEPLPFINLANTKGAIALYHMGFTQNQK